MKLNGKVVFQFRKDADVVDAACDLMENIPCFLGEENDSLAQILCDLRTWAERRRQLYYTL